MVEKRPDSRSAEARTGHGMCLGIDEDGDGARLVWWVRKAEMLCWCVGGELREEGWIEAW